VPVFGQDCQGSDTAEAVYSGYHGNGCNAGGHDLMSNWAAIFNGGHETGHCGSPLVSRAMVGTDLRSMGVPAAEHGLGLKHAHCGSEDSFAGIQFTLSSTGGISGAHSSYQQSGMGIDIYLCACRMGTDCAGPLFSQRTNCPSNESPNPCS